MRQKIFLTFVLLLMVVMGAWTPDYVRWTIDGVDGRRAN